jgi:hypothetical protein
MMPRRDNGLALEEAGSGVDAFSDHVVEQDACRLGAYFGLNSGCYRITTFRTLPSCSITAI